jgi:Mg-chelatase subunit ChlD
MGNRNRGSAAVVFFIVVMLISLFRGSSTHTRDRNAAQRSSQTANRPNLTPTELAEQVKPPAGVQWREGTALIVLIDTSGSMSQKVADAAGALKPKIDVAKTAARSVVDLVAKHAASQKNQEVQLGIYEFAGRFPNVVEKVVPLSAPNVAAASSAIDGMSPGGATPIGDAVLAAKRDLDASGLSRRHIVVVTDGDNTQGHPVNDVANVLFALPEKDRAALYFIAFDIDASTFSAIKEKGAMVLPAANEKDLLGTLEFLISGEILLEQPAQSK